MLSHCCSYSLESLYQCDKCNTWSKMVILQYNTDIMMYSNCLFQNVLFYTDLVYIIQYEVIYENNKVLMLP